MPPPVVRGQQVAERGEQVVVRAGAGLQDRDAGGGVRHEEVQQSVALAVDETGALAGQVVHHLARAGVHLQRLGPHAGQPVRPASYGGGMALEVTRAQVLAHRWRAHQLDREPESAPGLDDVALLDLGVQDTGPVAARWSLANRGLASYDEDDLLLAWTVRSSPHAYRRADAAGIAVATSPLSESDAAKRVFDASKPLKEAGIPVLEALAVIARTQRDLVRRPTVKGELSTALTSRLDPPYLRRCVPCNTTHAWENPFRMAPLQGGLELQPGTSPPVLRRVPGLRPSLFRHAGSEAEPRLDQVRGYLRFYVRPPAGRRGLPRRRGQGRPAHWPDDAVPVDVAASPTSRASASRSRRTSPRSPRHPSLPAGCACSRRTTRGCSSVSGPRWSPTPRTPRTCGASSAAPEPWSSTARRPDPGPSPRAAG